MIICSLEQLKRRAEISNETAIPSGSVVASSHARHGRGSDGWLGLPCEEGAGTGAHFDLLNERR